MKRILFFILLAFVLSACDQQEQNRNTTLIEKQEGIIGQKEQKLDGCQLLVIPSTKEEDISNKSVEELVRMAQQKDGAYYYVTTDVANDLEVGTQVKVYWNGSQNDSDPPQRTAEKIEIVMKLD